jgi:hypothetical protein
MNNIKDYRWLIITVPLLSLIIFSVIQKINPDMKSKRMLGASIFAIGFGIFLIIFCIINQLKVNKVYIVFGIFWILLGVGRLIYDNYKNH